MENGFDRQTLYGAHCIVDYKKGVFQARGKMQFQSTTQKSN